VPRAGQPVGWLPVIRERRFAPQRMGNNTVTVRRISIDTAPAQGAHTRRHLCERLFCSAGVGPTDPTTSEVFGSDVAEQTGQVLRNLQQLLESEGLGFSDVVKATVHLQDVERDFAAFNEVGLPVRTTVGSTLLGILVEIDVVAAYPERSAS
jgi:2-iminobutanoate/2-iminopropanoate deaminase